MQPRDFMNSAVEMAEKCQPDDPATTPKVGAVIAVGEHLVAAAHRERDDHAEKIALSKAPAGVNLSEATVYTTLEPCTQDVRRGRLDDCASRLVAAHVKKVVIGILDPNQGVCGKGVLLLQRADIEVELFPHDLAVKILRLNEDFVRAQQSLGIKITEPQSGKTIPKQLDKLTVKGTLINAPAAGDEVYAILRKKDHWWPQARISPSPGTTEWSTEVSIGGTGVYFVYVVRASALGKALIHHYYAVGNLHKRWRDELRQKFNDPSFQFSGGLYSPIELLSLPKGLDAEDWVEIEVV